jgi:hypothetical protein
MVTAGAILTSAGLQPRPPGGIPLDGASARQLSRNPAGLRHVYALVRRTMRSPLSVSAYGSPAGRRPCGSAPPSTLSCAARCARLSPSAPTARRPGGDPAGLRHRLGSRALHDALASLRRAYGSPAGRRPCGSTQRLRSRAPHDAPATVILLKCPCLSVGFGPDPGLPWTPGCPRRDIAELVAAVRVRWPAQHPGRAGQPPPQLPVRAGKVAGTRRGFPREGAQSRRDTSERRTVNGRFGSTPPREARHPQGGGALKAHQPDGPPMGLSTIPRKLAGAARGPEEPCGASRVFVSRKRAGCSRRSNLRLGPGSHRSPRESSGTAVAGPIEVARPALPVRRKDYGQRLSRRTDPTLHIFSHFPHSSRRLLGVGSTGLCTGVKDSGQRAQAAAMRASERLGTCGLPASG